MLILHYRILNHNNQGTQQVISLLAKMAVFFFSQNVSLSLFFMHEEGLNVLHTKAIIRQGYCHLDVRSEEDQEHKRKRFSAQH